MGSTSAGGRSSGRDLDLRVTTSLGMQHRAGFRCVVRHPGYGRAILGGWHRVSLREMAIAPWVRA